MEKSIAIVVGGRPSFSIAHEIAKLVNAGIITIVDGDSDEIQGIDHDSMFIDDLTGIEERMMDIVVHAPEQATSDYFKNAGKEHLRQCQPWKRKKKGRS